MHPDKIDTAEPNTIIIPGQYFDPSNLVIKMMDSVITNPVITSTLIKFTYMVSAGDVGKSAFNLEILDKAGKTLTAKILP